MMLSDRTIKRLKEIVGDKNVSTDKEDRICYSYDATNQQFLPEAVVFPGNVEEVSEIVKLANNESFPIVPRGAGSGFSGGSLPIKGGAVMVMERLNKIENIDRQNLTAVVQPGVVTGELQAEVERLGLFYPPDPSSSEFSTLGGNLAECAGGPRALKYGVTRDYVLGVEAVIPTGEIITTGTQTTKGVVGYDLTRLLIGSEGTLGVITRMTLRLLPLPEAIRTMSAVFSQVETAAETVSEIIRRSIIPRTIEFMDNASIRCVENHLKIGLPTEADALLIIEVDGKPHDIDMTIEELKTICISRGATRVDVARSQEEVERLWKARKSISPALFQYGPDKLSEDILNISG
jgi:glycolate oxidase